MSLIAPEHLDRIEIEKMIFHVVGPDEGSLVLLEEIDPGEHADFFVDRIKAAARGILFDFLDASAVLAALTRITAADDRFADESKSLAELFDQAHGGSASAGVFLMFALRVAGERLFAIIKYDHEAVLSYTIEEDEEDRRRAVIAALEDTFVQSPEALQKAAIIRLNQVGGELSVRDRVQPSKISLYFQTFLGAKRRFEPNMLTSKLSEVAKHTARKHQAELGPAVMGGLNRRVYDAIQAQPGFDPANKEPFLAAIFGPLGAESPVRKTFDRELKNNRMQDEVFDFDKAAVTQPRKKHMVTEEGIEIIYDRQYDDRVTREQMAGGGERIVVETGGVRIEDDYSESRPRQR